ncbi:helix-turn-helix domain-containing protein [Parasedimentitalea huanghaiensis]|uniref:helix-turn-helix domain-containing protein n=1 Tax=Parasedimentitalea huanghaiensis TaxID=2682100 RepID=UPI001ADC233C|nr:helix-turn-helix domain-containing protein [Zongyanglinia huanghaiensis]
MVGDKDLPHPKPTAQVQPYFEALGLEDTLNFLEAFGGSEIYIAENPTPRSQVVDIVGHAKARALFALVERLPARVPLAQQWRAQVYKSMGLKKAEIARKLGVTDVTVRKWLKPSENAVALKSDENQLSLFRSL